MTAPVWLLLPSCILLAIAPLWYLYRTHQLGSRRIALFSYWGALIMLGVAAVVLTIQYALPGILLFFIAVLYPILRIFMEDTLHNKKQARIIAPTNGQTSVLRSEWLEVRVEHSSGKILGAVLQGKMQHWHLHEMDGHDLLLLRHEFLSHDPLATALLDFWLDREGPVHWRRDFGINITTPTPTVQITSREIAAAILGVAVTAPPEAVAAATSQLENLIGKGSEHSTLLDMVAASARLLSA